jgi:hypothetical protein
MQPLWDFDSVVEALGGPAEVGRLTGNVASAVCNWRRQRNRFPTKYYFVMKSALADRGHYAPIHLWGFYSSVRDSQEAA